MNELIVVVTKLATIVGLLGICSTAVLTIMAVYLGAIVEQLRKLKEKSK